MGGDHCVHSFIQTYKTERIVSSYSDRSRFRLTPFDGLSTKADDKWTWKWMIIKDIIVKLNRIRLRFSYSPPPTHLFLPPCVCLILSII